MNRQLDNRGAGSLLLPLIIFVLLFVAAAGFAFWAFGGRQDYKNNVDAKIAAAVAANKQVVQAQDAKDNAEAAKSPLKTFVGPDAYGSLHLSYPKTWSAYINTTGSNPLDGYFHNDYLPTIDGSNASFNLRVQILNSSYSTVVNRYTNNVKNNTATASPYKLPQVQSVVGTMFTGKLFDKNSSGTLVALPVRDKTLILWVQDNSFLPDFNKYILPNVSFSP